MSWVSSRKRLKKQSTSYYDCGMIKPCKLSAALISMPTVKIRLDLRDAAKLLEERGYIIRIATDRILIVRNSDGLETSIYPSGKFLFKTKDTKKAMGECSVLSRMLLGLVSKGLEHH